MGSRLVTQAIVYALPRSNLTPTARTLLLVMCHTAQDSATNPLYFAGSTQLARALGYPLVIDRATGSSEQTTSAGKERVKRALRELVEAGFIERLPSLPRTWKRRWILTLPGLRAEGTRQFPHEGTSQFPRREPASSHVGNQPVPTQGTSGFPPEEETEEETEEERRRTM